MGFLQWDCPHLGFWMFLGLNFEASMEGLESGCGRNLAGISPYMLTKRTQGNHPKNLDSCCRFTQKHSNLHQKYTTPHLLLYILASPKKKHPPKFWVKTAEALECSLATSCSQRARVTWMWFCLKHQIVFFSFFHILGISSSQLTNSYFSEG